MPEAVRSGAKLRKSVACPNCWREFSPAQVRFISESPKLVGDPVMGTQEQLRFRAMRFDVSGNALDPHDMRCSRIACPTCHIEMPRAMLELAQVPISVVGAPGSGKTNLLASGMWGLAQRAADFGFQMVDADPAFNTTIHRNESMLFMGVDPSTDVTLPKTEEGGSDLYRTVRVAGVEEMVPRPAFFITNRIGASRRSVMVLYDNAGEHFMPGAFRGNFATSTRHLERSRSIVMVFDPLQDQRFRAKFAAGHSAPHAAGHERQELVFTEAIARVRRLRGLDPSAPVTIPIVIALTKADVWADAALGSEWWRLGASADSERLVAELKALSEKCRAVIRTIAPEFSSAVATLAEEVWFVPVSALGTSPARGLDGRFHLRAADIRPRWAEMPFVLSLLLAEGLGQRGDA
jgi:hypothetical protein